MKLKFSKIKKFLANFLTMIARHAFLACLFFFSLALILGAILFYKYCIANQEIEIGSLEKPIVLKEKLYEELLKVWKKQEEKFKEADFKKYRDPFLPPAPLFSEEELQEIIGIFNSIKI